MSQTCREGKIFETRNNGRILYFISRKLYIWNFHLDLKISVQIADDSLQSLFTLVIVDLSLF